MKVLIIEDDENIVRVLSQFIRPISAEIIVAQNMEQALKIVSEAQDIELITLDLGLPDSDVDSTLTKKLRQLRIIKPHALIIVVTGYDNPTFEALALSEGADGFITKQNELFTARGFLAIVARIVQKYMQVPQHPERSISMLEKVSTQIAKYHRELAATE